MGTSISSIEVSLRRALDDQWQLHHALLHHVVNRIVMVPNRFKALSATPCMNCCRSEVLHDRRWCSKTTGSSAKHWACHHHRCWHCGRHGGQRDLVDEPVQLEAADLRMASVGDANLDFPGAPGRWPDRPCGSPRAAARSEQHMFGRVRHSFLQVEILYRACPGTVRTERSARKETPKERHQDGVI